MWTAARTKDPGTKKSAAAVHAASSTCLSTCFAETLGGVRGLAGHEPPSACKALRQTFLCSKPPSLRAVWPQCASSGPHTCVWYQNWPVQWRVYDEDGAGKCSSKRGGSAVYRKLDPLVPLPRPCPPHTGSTEQPNAGQEPHTRRDPAEVSASDGSRWPTPALAAHGQHRES